MLVFKGMKTSREKRGKMIELKNETLTIQIAERGAELKSVVDNTTGIEYLWQADPKYWGRTSPILFPIVGKLKDDTYYLKNTAYHLPQHGFARDMEFTVAQQSDTSICFMCTDNAASFEHYPFAFKLLIRYELIADAVHVSWEVQNPDKTKILPFSIGAHPAFNLKMFDADMVEDFYLEFDKEIELASWQLTEGYFGTEYRDFGKSDSLKLATELFVNDALVFSNINLQTIALKNMRNNHGVLLDLTNFKYGDAERSLGIWSPYRDGDIAPFLCIEPWFGHADTVEGPFELIDKPGIILLEENGTFLTRYSLQFY